MSDDRKFDILLWGITGWTGVHLLEHFVQNYPLHKLEEHGVSWAVVARNERKMASVMKQVENNFHIHWMDLIETFTVDNNDEEAVAEVVSQAKSVTTVVGPYAKFGEPLVKACVENNTHYTDITGETIWVRKMIDKYQEEATEKGVFAIPCAGCDSIPSDISSFAAIDHLNQKMSEKYEEFSEATERKFTLRGYCTKNEMNNRHKDGPSGGGGSMASVMGIVENDTKELEKYNLLTADDDECKADKDHTVLKGVGREKRLPNQSWTTYFPIATGNEQVVRRSRYLMPHIYGKDMSIHEKLAVSNVFKASGTSTGLAIGLVVMSYSFTRNLAAKFFPKASQVPNPRPKKARYKPGAYEYVLFAEAEYKIGETVEKLSCKTTFSAPDEIAWTYTAIMQAESCLAIVKNTDAIREQSGVQGGLVTPACLGHILIERLRNQDIKIETVDLDLE